MTSNFPTPSSPSSDPAPVEGFQGVVSDQNLDTNGSQDSHSQEGSGISQDQKPSASSMMWKDVFVIITDIFALTVSLGHLVLVCIVMGHDGRPIDKRFKVFQDMLITLAPIFPTLFAFVIGRALYQLARLKLEKGAPLGTLEQLMGSRTLGASVMTLFELRSFNLLCLLLFCVWAFSPLGGQSFLHSLDKVSRPISTDILYLDTLNNPPDFGLGILTTTSFFHGLYSSNYAGLRPTDIWMNLKVPFLEPDHNDTNPGWRDRGPNSDSQYTYSSFFGVPVKHVSVGNSSFDIESSYLSLACEPFSKTQVETSSQTFISGETFLNETAFDTSSQHGSVGSKFLPVVNGSWYGRPHNYSWSVPISWNIAIDRFVDPLWLSNMSSENRPQVEDNQEHGGDQLNTETKTYTPHSLSIFQNYAQVEAGPTKLLFQARRNVSDATTVLNLEVLKTECRVLQKYVESRVLCFRLTEASQPECRVIGQRPSQRPHLSEDLSILSIPDTFERVSSFLPRLLSAQFYPDLILLYLYSQSKPASSGNEVQHEVPDFTAISEAEFSVSLSQIINSYIIIQQIGFYLLVSDGMIGQVPYRVKDWVQTSSDTDGILYVYSVNRPWGAVCAASCVILSIASILGVIFAHSCRGLDILGLVSTGIRDSKYVDMPSGGESLDGHELSIVMKNERLRYGHTHLSTKVTPVIGIGRERHIRKIKH
ncbi:unnamed protein product [Clonostachys solani]|uniref:Uncharacterized protein n=1 Tax=Clonostachys solani TaxID=160281 RepID=A0A9P0EKA6_9HYPO|nr:unnamed protein product [Clonostachys solani]